MEKRSLLALVLSMAVLFLWQYFFGGLWITPEQPPQQVERPAEPSQAVGPSTSPTPGTLPPKLSTGVLPEDLIRRIDEQFESWTILDSRYSLKILAPGARMGSFQLRDFRQTVAPDSPRMELVASKASGFLPLAVDLLRHPQWQISVRPFLSEMPAQVQLNPGDPPSTFSFHTEIPEQLKVTKALSLTPDSYVMDLEIVLENLSHEALEDQMGISFYFQPYGKAGQEIGDNVSRLAFYQKGDITTYKTKDVVQGGVVINPPVDWIGYENNYFIQAIIPVDDTRFQVVPRILDEDKALMQVVYLTDHFRIEPRSSQKFQLRLYIGPKEISRLEQAGHNLAQAVDYGWFSFLAKPLLKLLNWFYKYVHNYGLAIILLTILIKIIFWPLTHKSYVSMQNMKKVQPKIQALREKYKNDREKMNQELMAVYRTYKVNPLGGCLPMVLQIPVFLALYRMLSSAVELRHEPFIWWINDLTAPDRLDIGVALPYLGGVPVLTILMGLSMFVQQKMTPMTGDPRQEKIMMLMPVIFTIFFVNFPSGLVLYWLINNILSIAQQYYINNRKA